jgi:hypothetical protein
MPAHFLTLNILAIGRVFSVLLLDETGSLDQAQVASFLSFMLLINGLEQN